MAHQHAFDPHTFLAKVGAGRTIVACQPQSPIFAQGDATDAVFYIQHGQVKLSVVSARGKEAVIAILEARTFFGEGCLAGQPLRMATATARTDCSWHACERPGRTSWSDAGGRYYGRARPVALPAASNVTGGLAGLPWPGSPR
jgi:hypothetical protein